MVDCTVEFNPWIGANYQNTRWLLLGDSSYKGSEADIWHPGYRRRQSEEYVRGEWSARFENNTTSLIAGRPYREADRVRVWSCFALENYVNDSLAEKPPGESRPEVTKLQYSRAAQRFPHLVEELDPGKILVLGKGTFDRILKDVAALKFRHFGKYDGFINKETGRRVAMMAVQQPSAYFSWNKWYPAVNEFLFAEV